MIKFKKRGTDYISECGQYLIVKTEGTELATMENEKWQLRNEEDFEILWYGDTKREMVAQCQLIDLER